MKMQKNVLKTKAKAAMSAVTTGAMVAMMNIQAFATTGGGFTAYGGTDANKIMDGTKNLFGTIGTYGGGLYAIVAIFTLVLAIRNEDNEGRNKAILNLLAAIALLSMGVIINLFFN